MKPDQSAIARALEVVQGGGLIAYPTEAVFGLGCRADLPRPAEILFRLKGRDPDQGLIVLIDRLESLGDWIRPLGESQRRRLLERWPGPETWLLPAGSQCPPWLRGSHESLAVRMSAHPVCQALCRGLSVPLISTSANRSGQPPATTAAEVGEQFGDSLNFILDAPLGGASAPSQIFDLESGKRLR